MRKHCNCGKLCKLRKHNLYFNSFFLFFAESSKLCLKDLSDDVTDELSERLQAGESTLEKFYQFFGLKMGDSFPFQGGFLLREIRTMFPDTTVSVLKECFEVLRLYDLVDILEKVRPRSLRPAVSPEQIEKLRRAGVRPAKYHSDVAVLVVNHGLKEDVVEKEVVEKIETFFKDLNSRNDVARISVVCSQETRELLEEIKIRNRRMRRYKWHEDRLRTGLERILPQKARLTKELEMEKRPQQRQRLEIQLSRRPVEHEALWHIDDLENIAKEKNQAEKDFEKLIELEKESVKAISTAMDELIHNQGWLTSYTYTHVY